MINLGGGRRGPAPKRKPEPAKPTEPLTPVGRAFAWCGAAGVAAGIASLFVLPWWVSAWLLLPNAAIVLAVFTVLSMIFVVAPSERAIKRAVQRGDELGCDPWDVPGTDVDTIRLLRRRSELGTLRKQPGRVQRGTMESWR